MFSRPVNTGLKPAPRPRPENRLRDRPRRHPPNRLPRRSPSPARNRTHPVLYLPRPVRMPRTRNGLQQFIIPRACILVGYRNRDGRPQRHAPFDPRKNHRPVRLVPRSGEPRLPWPPPIQLPLHILHRQRHPGGTPIHDAPDGRAMRLAVRRDPEPISECVACHRWKTPFSVLYPIFPVPFNL